LELNSKSSEVYWREEYGEQRHRETLMAVSSLLDFWVKEYGL
jgi:hypothetical protein